MKYAKMLALAALAAGALMAFIGAGTASATVLCSTTTGNNPCPAGQKWVNQHLDFTVPAGGSLKLMDTVGNTIDTCKEGTVEGTLTNSGSATETPTTVLTTPVPTTGLTWSSCTFPTKTLSTEGKIKIHRIAGTSNGTVTSDSKFEVTINSIILGSCVYGVTTTEDLGELTEGKTGTATPPTFHANAVAEEFGGKAACPDTAVWTGTYALTSPPNTTLSVSES